MGVQNHDVILLFLLGMVLLTLNPMKVKINLRYEEENLHGKSREGRNRIIPVRYRKTLSAAGRFWPSALRR